MYEQPVGSGVWFICYYTKCVRHREKAGTRGDAIKLYMKRKADGLRGIKLPELVPGKVRQVQRPLNDGCSPRRNAPEDLPRLQGQGFDA